jgi:hypothetical protein
MFCQKCGTVVADTAVACLSCNTPIVSAGPARSAAGGALKAAGADALRALRSLAGNPIGALAPAYAELGDARALRAGTALGAGSLACFLLGGYLLLPPFVKEDLFEFLGFGGVLKCLAFASVPFVTVAAGSAAMRKVMGGANALGGDVFVAGASLLPVSLCVLLAGLLGLGNAEAVGLLAVFALCTATSMLFAGYTRVGKLGDRAGALAVPVVVVLSAWLAKVLATSVVSGPGGGDVPMMFPY